MHAIEIEAILNYLAVKLQDLPFQIRAFVTDAPDLRRYTPREDVIL